MTSFSPQPGRSYLIQSLLPSARTFPRAPNHCQPRNSTPALKFTEHSLQCLGGVGNDSKGSPAWQRFQWTSVKGPEAWPAKTNTTSRCPGSCQPGAAATAGTAGTAPCAPHRIPSAPHPHSSALSYPWLLLRTPDSSRLLRGLGTAPGRCPLLAHRA